MRTLYQYITLICFLFSFTQLQSQSGWTAPVPANYQFSASVTATFTLDGVLSTHTGDQIAFFYGNEIRGLGNSKPKPGGGRIFTLSVYSNIANQVLTIKVYNASNNQIYDALTTLTFVPQSINGTLANPFQITVFSNFDAPIDLLQIPSQTTLSGIPFISIPLNDYLVQTDNDPIVWSTNTNINLSVNIQNDSLLVTAFNGFTGQTSLRIKATEQTPNQYQDSVDVVFNVNEMYDDPNWVTHPSQGTSISAAFQSVDLHDYENEYTGNCLTFDYEPIIVEAIPPISSPQWTAITNLQATMNITAQVRYTPKLYLNNVNNKVAAFIGNEVRGVATGTMINGQIYFFLTVNNSNQNDTIRFKFYSDELDDVIDLDYKIVYVASGIIGSPQSPYIMDLSPLIPLISNNGTLNIQKNKLNWTGEQAFKMIVQDCNYPGLLNDTIGASYCVSSSPMNLALYFKDYDGDNYADTFNFNYCSRPLGYKLLSELVAPDIDCNDEVPEVNIDPAITLNDKCYPTIFAAIIDAKSGDTIIIHKNVETLENNILPHGITIKVLSNALWTNNALLINRGKIIIVGNVHFINGTAGVYKGRGLLSGNFLNYGKVSPGQ